MAALHRIAACLLAACAAACGGKSVDAVPDGHAGGSGNEAGAGGSSQAGTAHGGASGSAGTGQVGACTQYLDQNAWQVQVAILNETSKTIHLGDEMVSCMDNPNLGFTVTSDNGRALSPPNHCRTSCDTLIGTGNIGGCLGICLFPTAATLEPGEQFVTTWTGLFGQQITLPSQCGGSSRSPDCERAQHVQPGMFTFSSVAGLELDCSETQGGPCAACARDANGACMTKGALISGARLVTSTQVDLDGTYGVWGDSPSAGDPAPGASEPVPLRPVQLVFTD